MLHKEKVLGKHEIQFLIGKVVFRPDLLALTLTTPYIVSPVLPEENCHDSVSLLPK